MASFDSIRALAEDYIRWDPNSETKAQVQELLSANEFGKLENILSSRLAFGTAGLRGPMGAGFNHMNDIVILQTSQGLVRYLEECFGPQEARERGIVVGYDHRCLGSLSSTGFAKMTAAVFVSEGFKVHLLEDLVATPLVAFGVTRLNCVAGIMVTASHNPKQDNGYKVYWSNGSQIIPPHDSGIARCIGANLAPWRLYDVDGVVPLCNRATEDIANRYFSEVQRLCRHRADNASLPVKVAYTAMHGVGHPWVKRSFAAFGLPEPHAVPSQADPDPTFRTVVFPNPEEKGALNEAIKFANENGCTLIVANDPDADRLAVAELIPADGSNEARWHLFSGNEIGAILGHWQIAKWKEAGGADGAAVLASVVSSRMLRRIAQVENMVYYDTLTGFKWLGNRTIELRAQGTPVLFSYEEALGYCLGDVVCDKDGVSGAAVFAELAGQLHRRGLTVVQHLAQLGARYGEFVSYNSYVICRDPVKTDAIFHRIRNGGPTGGYWLEVAGAKIISIQDVTVGYSSTAADHKCDLPTTPDSHMIMFEFDNGVSATFRTSGTEPKIKYYTEIAGAVGQSKAELLPKIHAFVDAVVDSFLEPVANGLQRASA